MVIWGGVFQRVNSAPRGILEVLVNHKNDANLDLFVRNGRIGGLYE